jgi:hypothetical protein
MAGEPSAKCGLLQWGKQFENPQFEGLLARDYLCFSGGGVRGVSYLGALYVLEKVWERARLDIRTHWKGAGGSSVGSILALFVVLQLSVAEMCEEMKDFRPQVHGPPDVSLLYTDFGLYSTSLMETWIRGLLQRRVGDADITFQELSEQTNGRELRICVTNLSRGCGEVHDAHGTPHFCVWKSIIASAAVPVLFTPQVIAGEHFCDGGLACNFPTRLFKPECTLGMCLMKRQDQVSHDILTLPAYLGRMLSALASPEVPSSMAVIDIRNDGTVGHLALNPTDEQVKAVLKDGVYSCLQFLQQQSPPCLKLLLLCRTLVHVHRTLLNE